MVDSAYGVKSLSNSQINHIIKAVKEGKNTSDQQHSNGKKMTRTADIIAAVAAAVEEDRRITVRQLASRFGLTVGTTHAILTEDLGLFKKSARWVPKLLSPDQKQKRVELSADFLKLVRRHSAAVLNNIVTVDESAVSFHTPETKKQSKQWTKKGQPGPLKAKVHASRSKQMVLVFFDAKGVIYPAAKLSTPITSRRPWQGFWSFSGRKGPSCRPRTGFSTGTTRPSTPPPSSRSSWWRRASS